MAILNRDITDLLRIDAGIIKKLNKEFRHIKDNYKPEVATQKMTELIGSKISERSTRAKTISTFADKDIEKIRKEHEMQCRSEKHQLTISNILKLLELSNYEVKDDQFKEIVAPLVEVNDYATLSMLGNILNSKNKLNLSDYCVEKSNNNEIAVTEKMMEAIKEYINTDIVVAVGGDPIKYKNSSYDEILLTAQKLGYDIDGLEKEYASNEIVADINAFSNRQIGTAMGIPQEEPIFNNLHSGDAVAQQVETSIGVN